MCHPPIKILKSKQNKEKNKAVAQLQKTKDVTKKKKTIKKKKNPDKEKKPYTKVFCN